MWYKESTLPAYYNYKHIYFNEALAWLLDNEGDLKSIKQHLEKTGMIEGYGLEELIQETIED